MDDLILAARLFEKGYVPNLEGGGLRNRLWQGGKNLARGLAGRVAQSQPAQALTQVMGEGQEARYGKGYRATNVPSDRQAANVDRIDPNRISHVPPTTPAATAPAATAPTTDTSGMAAMGDAQVDTNNDGQLTADDTVGRKTTTEVEQQLNPADGTVANTTTTHKTVDTNHDGVIDEKDAPAPAINSPDPNPNATTPATNQNAQNAQVANAQKLANSGFGGIGANIATMGGAALVGGINRWRGNRKLNALANATPGAGGDSNANMISASRANGTEFLDDHWNLQKARMEARERATTEAIRNAYR